MLTWSVVKKTNERKIERTNDQITKVSGPEVQRIFHMIFVEHNNQ